MKKIATALLMMASSTLALADNGPGCGMGAEIWKGQSGLVAHLSAGTTNGTFSSPLSGLISGTSGCEDPGIVSNDYQQKIFVSMNLDDLAQDVAKGNGDHLSSLATLMGIKNEDKSAFNSLAQQNYEKIFISSAGDYKGVLNAFDKVISSNDHFAHYAL